MKQSTKSLSNKRAYKRTFLLACISLLITSTLTITSANANPLMVAVNPTSGSVGTTVTVSGSDATAEAEVRVYMTVFLTSFFLATTNTNSTGGFTVNITVPTFPAGEYSLLAFDVTTEDTGTAPFTIQPDITVSPGNGSCSDEVTVEGHGFDSNSPIKLTFDGANVTPPSGPTPQPRTDTLGSFKAKFRVPQMPKGTYTVSASDGVNTASTRFTVAPKITLSSTSGSPATPVSVDGTGFAPSAYVSVEFNSINVTVYPTFPTALDGSFRQLFFVPNVADGSYTVKATDEIGNTATAPFVTPSPQMTVTPNITSAPAVVAVTGTGFPPNAPILLYLEDIFVVDFIDLMIENQALFADEYGSYEYSFVISTAKPGVYEVAAYSVVGDFDFATDEVLASAPITIVEDALLVDIEDQITTIIIPSLETLETNLTAIDAQLISIEGETATIKTTLGTVEGRITSIEGNTATIQTEMGTVTADISHLKKTQETFTLPLYAALAAALAAAAAAIILLIMHVQVMRKPKA